MGTHDKRPSIKEPFDFGQTFITAKWNSWQRVPTLLVGLRVNWNFWRCLRNHFAAVKVNIGVMKVLTKLSIVLREALSKIVTSGFAMSARVFDPDIFRMKL